MKRINTLTKIILLSCLIAAPAQGMEYVAKTWFYLRNYNQPHFQAWQKIRAERDSILQASVEKSSGNEKEKFLWVTAAIEQVKKEEYETHYNNPQHFTQTCKNINERLQKELSDIMKSHDSYKNYTQDDIGFLDLSAKDMPEGVKEIGTSPLAIMLDFDKILTLDKIDDIPEELLYIRKKLHKAKHIIYYDSFMAPTLESLIAGLGHELAHATQPYHRERFDNAIGQLAEIDADIKNLCIQKSDGTWIVRDNAYDIIKNFICFLSCCEQRADKVFEMLTVDLYGQAYDDAQQLLRPLRNSMHSKHPIVKHRQFIMEEFIKTMEDFGDSMTDEEFHATIGIIATCQCMENKLHLSDKFLKIVDLESAKKLKRVTACMKIPDVEAYCKNQK